VLDQAAVTQTLDQYLLTEDEIIKGKAHWEMFSDPFLDWEKSA